jgi:hypothetical protein
VGSQWALFTAGPCPCKVPPLAPLYTIHNCVIHSKDTISKSLFSTSPTSLILLQCFREPRQRHPYSQCPATFDEGPSIEECLQRRWWNHLSSYSATGALPNVVGHGSWKCSHQPTSLRTLNGHIYRVKVIIMARGQRNIPVLFFYGKVRDLTLDPALWTFEFHSDVCWTTRDCNKSFHLYCRGLP